MKKIIFGLLTLLILSAVQINPVGASVNDFTIKDFQADYYLNKDSKGYSTLKTVELITATFPDSNQNHGIERVIPLQYDGHDVNLELQSIKDTNGADVKYSTSKSNNNLVVRIGDAGSFVHGDKQYVVSYNQKNVTKTFSNTADDEFYWDVNGTGWSQPFTSVTARLHLNADVAGLLNDKQSCYYGAEGANNKCQIIKSDDGLIATATNLKAGENMTIAVGFKQNSFQAYRMSLSEFIARNIIWIEAVFVMLLIVAVLIIKITKDKSAPGRGTIVAEYLPPKGIDVAMASVIGGNSLTWVSATYIDLAVRHKIRIIKNEDSGLFKKIFTLELLSVDGLTATEKDVVAALFGADCQVGKKYEIKSNKQDYKLSSALTKIYKGVQNQAKANGYYLVNKKPHSIMLLLSAFILVQSIILGFVFNYNDSNIIVFMIGLFGTSIALIIKSAQKPLSSTGREISDYLKGLKLYIKIAEEDRIKFLQSPSGAAQAAVDVNDTGAVLRLYERVLPYAVLFGIESEWTKVLGKYYEQQNTNPDWYVGDSIFNSVMFASAISSFSSSAASATYTSSSSGGSSGGGFSGGGGGGGGGGGW